MTIGGQRSEKGNIQSVTRAAAILEEVARASDDGASLGAISKGVGLHNSTTFTLARTLVATGLLRQDEDTRNYRLGKLIYALAANVRSEGNLLRIAKPYLAELADTALGASQIAVLAGNSVMVIGKYECTGAFHVLEKTSPVLEAHETVAGKVMLAALPDDAIETFVARLDPFDPGSAINIAQFRKELAAVRANGIAIDNGEFHPELLRLAAPVRDYTGETIAAIGASIPLWRLSLTGIDQVIEATRQAAERLSNELGAM